MFLSRAGWWPPRRGYWQPHRDARQTCCYPLRGWPLFQVSALAGWRGLCRKNSKAARQAALKETIGQNIPQTKTDESIREEYELSRQAQKEAGVVIPAWEDLKADEKDTYLGSLKTNPSAEDFDNAAKTLAAYREQNKGSGLKPVEQRIVNGYEENRPIFQRSLGIDIPAWGSLSPEAQSAYTSKVKTNSPVEQDAGFTAEELSLLGT